MAGVLHLMDLARGGPIGLLAPILATIPFSGSFSIERNNGFLPFVFVRSDKNTYIWSKLLTTGLSGAFVLTIPYVLFFLGLIIRFPNLPLDNSLAGPFGDVAHTSPIVYIFRSEEHTSELQSRGHLVCRLLLEKKNDIMTS